MPNYIIIKYFYPLCQWVFDLVFCQDQGYERLEVRPWTLINGLPENVDS
jgi:hypothetical protein